MKLFLTLLLLALAAPLAHAGSARQSTHKITCENARYEYVLYLPTPGTASADAAPRPVIMVLHGAGDHADLFIDTWKKLARKENVVIIAPELPRKAEFEPLAPTVFRCMLKDAASLTPLDPRQTFLFGHSMGGYLAYDAAIFDADVFAAVAVHAMMIEPAYQGIVKRARRKTPVKIYIGDQDQLIPLAGVRSTRDLLIREGFPVEYQELKGHDHNYDALSDQINADAWKFFQQHPFAETAKPQGAAPEGKQQI
jgi:predicted esterase